MKAHEDLIKKDIEDITKRASVKDTWQETMIGIIKDNKDTFYFSQPKTVRALRKWYEEEMKNV